MPRLPGARRQPLDGRVHERVTLTSEEPFVERVCGSLSVPHDVNVRHALYKVYWAMRARITPGLRYSQDLYEDILGAYVTRETRWVDLGCGHQVLPSWRPEEEDRLVKRCRVIVGVDYDLPSLLKHRSIRLKVRADMTRLPFADESFDLVTANMVVEHLDNPDTQFREVGRVLRPGGVFIFHTPNALGYFTMLARVIPRPIKLRFVYLLDGRTPEDVFPAYYRANSRRRIELLARMTGLQVERFKLLVSDAMFASVPPLAFVELLWLRMLMTRHFKPLRTNIIVVMRKRARTPMAAAV